MPNPNIDLTDGLLPGFRGIEDFTIGADDIEFPEPRLVLCIDAGDLDFEDAEGNEHSLTFAAGASVTGPVGGGVYIRTVRGTSTVTEIRTGVS